MGRPSNALQRRKEIVAAFLNELGANGYEATSMARLGEVTGLKPSLMHYYFSNKLQILLASIPELERAYGDRRDHYLQSAVGPEQKLRALIDAHLALDKRSDPRHVSAWIQLMALAQIEKAIGRVMRNLIKKRHAEFAACFDKDQITRATGCIAVILGMFQISAFSPDLIPKGSAAAIVKEQLHV